MSRSRLVACWVTTGLVASSMLSAGVAHVLHVPASVDGFVRLGYPLHFVTLLGIWKILGALALLAPKFPRLTEWAHAGIAFDLTGAAFACAVVGDRLPQQRWPDHRAARGPRVGADVVGAAAGLAQAAGPRSRF